MGEQVREKPKDPGTYWVFINHHGRRKAKRVGEEKTAKAAVAKINTKLVLGEFSFDRKEESATFKNVADMPSNMKSSTGTRYVTCPLNTKSAHAILPLWLNRNPPYLFEQAQQFIDGKYCPTLLCALRTGMRVVELQALKWSDIDFDSRIIEVSRGLKRCRITRTKNKKSRSVDMTPLLTDVLKNHRTQQSSWGIPALKSLMTHMDTGFPAVSRARLTTWIT